MRCACPQLHTDPPSSRRAALPFAGTSVGYAFLTDHDPVEGAQCSRAELRFAIHRVRGFCCFGAGRSAVQVGGSIPAGARSGGSAAGQGEAINATWNFGSASAKIKQVRGFAGGVGAGVER